MTKLDITKIVVTTVVGFGASKIAKSICLNNTPTDNIPDKVMVHSAAFVAGMMASELTRKYTNAKIDEIAVWYNERVINAKNA
jgi:hypothetical protein